MTLACRCRLGRLEVEAPAWPCRAHVHAGLTRAQKRTHEAHTRGHGHTGWLAFFSASSALRSVSLTDCMES